MVKPEFYSDWEEISKSDKDWSHQVLEANDHEFPQDSFTKAMLTSILSRSQENTQFLIRILKQLVFQTKHEIETIMPYFDYDSDDEYLSCSMISLVCFIFLKVLVYCNKYFSPLI